MHGQRAAGPSFEFYRLRFRFQAGGAIHFPLGSSGNMIRGAFGTILRNVACPKEYAQIFEPRSDGTGPSGLKNWPRPFVFRAAHLNQKTVTPGTAFHFDVHLFDIRERPIACFVEAFAELARAGLGPGRTPAALVAVDQLNLAGETVARLYDGQAMLAVSAPAPSSVPLSVYDHPPASLRIEFVSPTELKCEDGLAREPVFRILFARSRDRIATLHAFYGAGPLDIDFSRLGGIAGQVRMTRCELRNIEVSRLSSRTGQRHPIGGFVGSAEYEGPLAELVPFIEAAVYAGVGRQTTFGKGEIRMELPTRA